MATYGTEGMGAAGPQPPPRGSGGLAAAIERYFEVKEKGSSIETEMRGGLVMWMTMSYIIVVNPSILIHGATILNPMPFQGVATGTCVCAFLSCLMTGFSTNLPLGLMSGMGLNAYFAYGACRSLGIPWQVVLAGCVVHGVIFAILAMTGVCSRLTNVVPDSVKYGITVGIGLFQAFLGFQMMGVVVPSDLTMVTLGDVWRPETILSFGGIFLISVMMIAQVKGAMFLGIVTVTLISWISGLAPWPRHWVSSPSLEGVFFVADFQGLWQHLGDMAGVIMAFLFVSIFDIAGVLYGICLRAGLLTAEREVPKSDQAFTASALGSVVGGFLGTSPVIIANETTAGVIEGARTGLAAVVASVLFLVSSFFTPAIAAVPPLASSVPLVIVGFFMMAPAQFIRWDHTYEGLPAFLTVTVMTLTYSIANGVIAGLLAHNALTLGVAVIRCFGVEVTLDPPADEEEEATAYPTDDLPRQPSSLALPHPHKVATPYANEDFQRRHSMNYLPSPMVRGGSSHDAAPPNPQGV